jgi:hypothetical protein
MVPQQRAFSIMYGLLSLTNPTVLTANMIPSIRKILSVIHDYHSHLYRKMYSRLWVQCHSCPIWTPVLPVNVTYTLLRVMNRRVYYSINFISPKWFRIFVVTWLCVQPQDDVSRDLSKTTFYRLANNHLYVCDLKVRLVLRRTYTRWQD